MNEKQIVKNYLNELGVNDDNIDLKLNMKKEEIPSGLLMKNAEKFIDRVYKLLKAKKSITLFTDLDADGWGAAVRASPRANRARPPARSCARS